MRNNAFVICLTTLVVGIFGFFLRWLQTLNGFDENGLAIPGAATAIVFLVYSVLALGAFALVLRFYLRGKRAPTLASGAFRAPNAIPGLVMWVLAVLMVIACLVLMFSSDFARYPTMQRLTSALGIFAGLCLPFIIKAKAEGENKAEDKGPAAIAALIPVLFCSLWLVTAYRVEAENPVLWSYVLEILGIIAAAVSFYYIAAYFYGRANPARCLFTLQLAVYLCLTTLMDEHAFAEKLLFGVLAAVFLVFEYLIFSNIGEAKEE